MGQEAVASTRQEALAILTAPGQPYELETVEIGGRPRRAFKNAPRSLRQMFAETASDLPFLVYENERMTFAQAWQQASRMAHVMVHEYGIEKGDRVAISMRNYPEWMLAFMAITSIGGIAVAMNAFWQSEEMDYGLRDSGARLLFADQERLERLSHCPPNPDLKVIAVRPSRPWPEHAEWQALLSAQGRHGEGDISMPEGRHRAGRSRQDALHLGLHGASERCGHHAPQCLVGPLVLGARRQSRRTGRGHHAAGASATTRHAARRPLVSCHRPQCGVPDLVPAAAARGVDVQVGPGSGRRTDRARAHQLFRGARGHDRRPRAHSLTNKA